MTKISAAEVAEMREKPAARSTMLADVEELSPLELPVLLDESLLPLSGNELAVVVLASVGADAELMSVMADVVLVSVDVDAAVILSVDSDAAVMLSVDPDAAVVLSVDADAVLLSVDVD